ncbi:MAG: glycosyltransferase [Candidatus Vogelbacteria bacterium]|nr:glycosyltransferase [Candidatus Vogelbacteria bacterium]
MVKIVYVVTKGRWGGAQKYVYDLATNLPPKRFAILVVTGQGEQLAQKLTASGVPCRTLVRLGRDIKFFDDLAVGWELYRLFKTEQPDIIHLNSSKIGLVGALAGRLYNLKVYPPMRRAKIIFTAHGWAFNEDRMWLARAGLKILHWLTVLICHQTIAVAETTNRQLTHWPGANHKITVIRNGVSRIEFTERAAAQHALLSDSASQRQGLWIGTISELHKNKGLTYLFQALKRLNLDCQGLTLTVIVIGEGEERKNLEKQIRKLGLENTVFLVGQKNDAASLLTAFDIFTLTSITEALPYVLLEAGLAGLPVVTTAVGGVPEIVTSMESGILIKPRQPAEIAKALQFLIARPDKRAKFGSRLRQKVRREFSTARMVKQTLAVYSSVK